MVDAAGGRGEEVASRAGGGRGRRDGRSSSLRRSAPRDRPCYHVLGAVGRVVVGWVRRRVPARVRLQLGGHWLAGLLFPFSRRRSCRTHASPDHDAATSAMASSEAPAPQEQRRRVSRRTRSRRRGAGVELPSACCCDSVTTGSPTSFSPLPPAQPAIVVSSSSSAAAAGGGIELPSMCGCDSATTGSLASFSLLPPAQPATVISSSSSVAAAEASSAVTTTG